MNAKQMLFLQAVVPAAMTSMAETGVPASVTVAQAILESGWGATHLATLANNFFGIKAKANATPDQYMAFPTAEYINGQRETVTAEFARYPDAAASFSAHASLLSSAPRYAPAMAVKNDPAAFCEQLQKCGYSTAPDYANKLQTILREFDLTQYDRLA